MIKPDENMLKDSGQTLGVLVHGVHTANCTLARLPPRLQA